MIALYKDPQGSKVFGKEMIESSETILRVALQAEKSRVAALEKEIQSLQKMLKQQQSVEEMDHDNKPVSRVGEKSWGKFKSCKDEPVIV